MTKPFEVYDSTLAPSPVELDRLPKWAYKYLTPRIGSDGRTLLLDVGQYVGSIPLIGGGALYLVPRAGRSAFVRMLTKAEGIDDSLVTTDEQTIFGSAQERGPWLKLLERPYLNRLRQIEKESLAPGRKEVRMALPHARGRLDVIPTLIGLARRSARPVHSHYRARTFSTPENRVLAAAAERLLQLDLVEHSDRRRTAVRWAHRLESKRLRREELDHVVAGLARRQYDGPRSYYAPALFTARLILAQASLNLGYDDPVQADALLLYVPLLFERYVRAVLMEALDGQGYQIGRAETLTAIGSQRALYTTGQVKMNPDVIAIDAAGKRVIIDAKYKPSVAVSSDDHYQMASYLRAYDSRVGVFVRPADTLTQTVRKSHSGNYVAELSLDLADPIAAELHLIESIRHSFQIC